MLDSDMNCWLIEANTNPCLEETSKLLEGLLPRLLDDMMKHTIDKVFSSDKNLQGKDFNKKADYLNGPNLISSVLKQRNGQLVTNGTTEAKTV